MNGDNREDRQGEFTQTRKGCTVIDYALVGMENIERVSMKIGSRIESDHEPVEIKVDEDWTEVNALEEPKRTINWGEEAKKEYKEKIKKELEENRVENLEELKDIMRRSMRYKINGYGRRAKNEEWWTRECTGAKGKVCRAKRQFRNGKLAEIGVREAMKEYRDIVTQSKKEYMKRKVKEMEKCRNEKDSWGLLRKNRAGVSKKISKHEWAEFFRESYEGKDVITEMREGYAAEAQRS